ncbi:hypothetical protein [Chryseobacterium sp. GP-SGM7]|uniref:hypothetical protein n=1 Tax=Chryseobacterium sp. GP-SGM7 TaxID=3411323 RepID=UPI003B941223
MKNLFLISGVIFTLISCSIQTKAQNGKSGKDGVSSNSKLSFNQKLADSLGADKYGMKPYVIVMLTSGTVKIDDQEKKQN